MSSEEDPNVIAKRAERDMNTDAVKQGKKPLSDSAAESGIDQNVETKFPGAEVKYGSEASGAGDNRDIPNDEGGETHPELGRQTKAKDFEGTGGPEEQMQEREVQRPGDQDVPWNVRQGTETRRPNPTGGDVQ